MPAAAGDILRVEHFAGAPKNANAWRMLYRSTGIAGEAIIVSGVIIAPKGPAPVGGRPVVAWAHPTTGVATRCAPSLTKEFTFSRTPGMDDFLKRGYVIAATDYPGLGGPGAHPYLVGLSESRAVLDSVRAANNLAEAGAGKTFAVWGHSQGGHAALYTGEEAASYAPDLTLVGVAAAAPATDLATLLRDDSSSKQGKMLTAFALWSWNRVYDAPLSPLLSRNAEDAVNRIAADCIEGPLEIIAVDQREKALQKQFLKSDITKLEPWKSLLARNTPGSKAPGAPLYIVQGSDDHIVRPDVTVSYVEALCRRGARVDLDWRKGVGHIPLGFESADAAAQWIAARFAGSPAPDDCSNVAALTASES